MSLSDHPDTLPIAFEARALPSDERREPRSAVATGLAETVAETPRLDPTRRDIGEAPPPSARGAWRGPVTSLLLHLLPLLALLTWLRPPLPVPPPIPIQLVIEQPPPPPPPPPQPAVKPQPPPVSGLHASDDFGAVGPKAPQKGDDAEKPTKGETAEPEPEPPKDPPKPPPQPTEALVQPPPEQPPQPIEDLPQPPTQLAEVLIPPPAQPKPAPPKPQPTPRSQILEGLQLPLPLRQNRPHTAAASARYPGPNATRDEYCAYALALTLRHLDLLPISLVGARRGDTSVTIRLREDGSIVSAQVSRGSGYLDIDERVVQMVMAVGRFPPLPAWLPGPIADFTFHLHFPHPMER